MSDLAAVISPTTTFRSLDQWLQGRTIISCEDGGRTPAGHAHNLILHLDNGEAVRVSLASWWGKSEEEEWPEKKGEAGSLN